MTVQHILGNMTKIIPFHLLLLYPLSLGNQCTCHILHLLPKRITCSWAFHPDSLSLHLHIVWITQEHKIWNPTQFFSPWCTQSSTLKHEMLHTFSLPHMLQLVCMDTTIVMTLLHNKGSSPSLIFTISLHDFNESGQRKTMVQQNYVHFTLSGCITQLFVHQSLNLIDIIWNVLYRT